MNNLTEEDMQILNEALDDEYRSWATYNQVVADFGEIQLFSNIREAEARHIAALQALFTQHKLPVPENPWPGKVERYSNLQAACEAAVVAEIANGEMYARLLAATHRPDIIAVLRNLQEASRERHLPSFQRCAQQTGDKGGSGHGRRHRHGAGS